VLSISQTAYPRFKSNITEKDLDLIYTPSAEELGFAKHHARSPVPRLGLLVLLKTFQRLGYFPMLNEIPNPIIQHIAKTSGFLFIPDELRNYETANIRRRHLSLIRTFLGVKAYSRESQQAMIKACVEASRTKDELADIINVALSELVRQSFELPAFSTLLRAARTARATVNRGYYNLAHNALDAAQKACLDTVLKRNPEESRSFWDRVKYEPKSPTLKHMKELIDHLNWLKTQNVGASALMALPDVKIKQFAAEARTLNLTLMNGLQSPKRYTLAAALIREQVARSLDDVAEMFVRRMQRIHNKAQEALVLYRAQHLEQTDSLIALLKETASAYKIEGTKEQRFEAMEAIIGEDVDDIIERCEAHQAYAGNNYFPFLPRFYKNYRSTLFNFIESIKLISTSQDRSVEVDRRYFEICLFSQIMQELKSGDLYIEGSDKFSDYRDQLISWEEYEQEVATYGEQTGLVVEGNAFVEELRRRLFEAAKLTDESFPDNEYIRIEKGEPILRNLRGKPEPKELKLLEKLIEERMPPINILDVLIDTELWLNWTRHFGPISGLEAKIAQKSERYVTMTFCYGCYLGPMQTSRSIKGFDRKQIAFINHKHVTEERLDKIIVDVINKYNCFVLPKVWGSGERVSADGMKWDLYEQNLLSERHIRYGGYGGLGYYHVSDTYIALFSHFIPCGVWEAVYILDALLKNRSDIQPDTVHADTQGQSAPVFGLAYLLGIKLMPRIRNWKDLKLFRPSKDAQYQHIDQLFSDEVDWGLTETFLPDMLRVALSIKAGRITPSTLLRRLGTYSRKNKLYFAFRELGRVERTIFLLNYLRDIELRRVIQGATNKSEAFNGFLQWVAFGNKGIITENIRSEQRKVIKYNHLVANLVIFHNVVNLSKIVRELVTEGHPVTREALAVLSPYQTEHINRFGTYTLNMDRKPPKLNYHMDLGVK
jgi:TnpA family transposase